MTNKINVTWRGWCNLLPVIEWMKNEKGFGWLRNYGFWLSYQCILKWNNLSHDLIEMSNEIIISVKSIKMNEQKPMIKCWSFQFSSLTLKSFNIRYSHVFRYSPQTTNEGQRSEVWGRLEAKWGSDFERGFQWIVKREGSLNPLAIN